MVQSRIAQQLEKTDRSPRLRISGAKNDAWNASLQDRSGTHRTRLQRHIERRLFQTPIADRGGGLRDRDHLRMGGRILQHLSLIGSGTDDLVIADDQGANGHFIIDDGLMSQLESSPHKVLVDLPLRYHFSDFLLDGISELCKRRI